MRLSDAFEKAGVKGKAPLDLTVTVLNVNAGCNKTLMRRNKTLAEYATFIQKVREQEQVLGNLAQGIQAAVDYCLKHDILKSFLKKYATEVFDMLEGEWDLDTALKVHGEECREEGREEGRDEGWDEVLELVEQGYNVRQIRDMLARRQSATSTAQSGEPPSDSSFLSPR
jgi:hypothetical protein